MLAGEKHRIFCLLRLPLLVLFVTSFLQLPGHVAFGVPIFPVVTVTVHRIQAVDPIESGLEGEADWFFHIGYRVQGNPSFTWVGPTYAPADTDDATIDEVISFQVAASSVEVVIELCEDDSATADDYADVSSDSFEGVDNVDCITRPPTGTWYGASFHTTYSPVSDSMSGDATTLELGWFKTSGEFDGSTTIDANDAHVFFSVTDNYAPPSANAGPDKTGFTGATLSFDGTGSSASSGSSIEQYAWDFTGDSIPDMSGEIVSWTFNTKGSHTVTLRVTDSIGITDTDTATVTIQNRSPTANFVFSPNNPTVEDVVSFSDTSTDSDGTISSWLWNFGDSTTSTIPNPTHQYSTNGPRTVTLTVTDNDGATATTTLTVTIVNVLPTANFTYSPSSITTAVEVQFSDSSTDRDGTITSWSWNYGDGSTTSTRNPVHRFTQAGVYQVSLTVTDDDGGTHSITKSISIDQEPLGGRIAGIPTLVIMPVAGAVVASVIILLMKRRKSGIQPTTSA